MSNSRQMLNRKMLNSDLRERPWLELVCLALLLVLRVAILKGEEKAKNPTAFRKDESFWKGLLKTLHDIEKWEEEVYLLVEVDLQEMSSALMYS